MTWPFIDWPGACSGGPAVVRPGTISRRATLTLSRARTRAGLHHRSAPVPLAVTTQAGDLGVSKTTPVPTGWSRCQLTLPGYLPRCEPARSAGHRRPVSAPLPVRRPGGAAGPGRRGQDPAAHPARAAWPDLSDGANAGRAAGGTPAAACSAGRLPAAATPDRVT